MIPISVNFTCYSSGGKGHKTPFCPNKCSAPVAHRANSVLSAKNKWEYRWIIFTDRISAYVGKDRECDELEIVKLRCGGNIVNGIYGSGAQSSMIRADLVKDITGEGKGRIKTTSALGKNKGTPLRIIPMRLDQKTHGEIPVICAISKKWMNDILIY